MGSFAAGLASVGGSLAQAKELRRQEQLEKIKLALEQSRLEGEKARTGIEQRYADIAALREKRLSQPSIQQWKLIGNDMIAAGQNLDGSPFVKTFPLNREIGMQLRALQDEISHAPAAIQPLLQSMTWEKISEGDIEGAAKDIRGIMQTVAKSQIPGQETVTTGPPQLVPSYVPGVGNVWLERPNVRTTQRLPAGQAPTGPSAPLPLPQGGLEEIPTPITGAATDFPGAPQAGVSGAAPLPPGTANVQPPPGSRIFSARPMPTTKATGQLKPEMQAGLRVLHASLFGGPIVPGGPSLPGLSSTVGVLDSKISRGRLIASGVGGSPNPNQWVPSKFFQAGAYSALTEAEKKYAYQLARAVDSINSLRSITGLPRSTQVLMDRYVMQLPDPVTTPSSKDALYKLDLIEREMQAAMTDATSGTGGVNQSPGPSVTPPATPPSGPNLSPGAVKALDSILGPAK